MMVVSVSTDGEAFGAAPAVALFDVEIPEASAPYPSHYAASADGQKFLVNSVVEQASHPMLTVVLNWTAEVAK